MPVRHYPAIVEGDAESGYSVFFPDLPGCTSGGGTLQEAALNTEEALAGHLALMLEAGEEVPPPGLLDGLAVEPDVVEAAHVCWCGSACARRSRRDAQGLTLQSCQARPATRANSVALAVTSVAPVRSAWAAISRS
jgi:predicted RNase H-like HicB family nuclease